MKKLLLIALLMIQGFSAQAIVLAEGAVRPQEMARLEIQNSSGFYSNIAAAQLTRISFEMTNQIGFVLDVRYRAQVQSRIQFIVQNVQRGSCNEIIYSGELRSPYVRFTQGKPLITVRDNRTNTCPTLIALPAWQVSVQNDSTVYDFIHFNGNPDPIFTMMTVGNRQ